MFKTFRVAALVAGALIAVPALAADSPVVGTWATVAETQMGNFEATMTVAEAGEGYTVEMVDAPMAGPDGQPAPAMANEDPAPARSDGQYAASPRSATRPECQLGRRTCATASK